MIKSGATATIVVHVRALIPGALRNVVSAIAVTTDPTPDDEVSADTVQAQPARPPAVTALGLSKLGSPTIRRAGQIVTFGLQVANRSPMTLNGVQTCDDLPAGLSYVSSTPTATVSNGRICWTLSSLASGNAKIFTLRARVVAGAARTEINHATATAARPHVPEAGAEAPVHVTPETSPFTG